MKWSKKEGFSNWATQKIRHLQKVSFLYARLTPGFDEKILAAVKSIETGNLLPHKGLDPKDLFVQFFKFAEGEEENHNEVHQERPSHTEHQQ